MTSEDRVLPLENIVKRVSSGDTNILFPLIRSDGQESNKRKHAVFRILCTMYFLVVFYNFNPRFSPLRVAMVKWKAFGASVKETSNSVFAMRIRVLIQRKLEGNRSDVELLRFLVSDLTNTTTEVDRRLVYLDGPVEQACLSLLNVFVGYHTRRTQTEQGFTFILNCLRKGMSETNFTLTACLLKRQMMISPYLGKKIILEALKTVRQFHNWQDPYGRMAVELMNLLTMEAKSPGCTWRRCLERHFPGLKSESEKVNGKELDVYLFCGNNSMLGRLIDSCQHREMDEKQLIRSVILGVFRSSGASSIEEESSSSLFQQLHYFSEKKLTGFYQKMREALEHSIAISSIDDARVFVEQRLERLKRAAEKYILKALHKASKDELLEPKIQATTTLVIPHRIHVNRVNFDCTLAGKVAQKLPRRNAHKQLQEVVETSVKWWDSLTVKKRVKLKILIEGGDTEFHHMLSTYVGLVESSEGKILEKVKFQFYLIPSLKGRCKLQSYLNYVDPWYHKTMSSVTKAVVSLSPSVGAAEDEERRETLENKLGLSPSHISRAVIAEYLEMAAHKNKLKIYTCECWQKSVSKQDTSSKYIIPFAIDAEFGMAAQGTNHRNICLI